MMLAGCMCPCGWRLLAIPKVDQGFRGVQSLPATALDRAHDAASNSARRETESGQVVAPAALGGYGHAPTASNGDTCHGGSRRAACRLSRSSARNAATASGVILPARCRRGLRLMVDISAPRKPSGFLNRYHVDIQSPERPQHCAACVSLGSDSGIRLQLLITVHDRGTMLVDQLAGLIHPVECPQCGLQQEKPGLIG